MRPALDATGWSAAKSARISRAPRPVQGMVTPSEFTIRTPPAVNLGIRIKEIMPPTLGAVAGTVITLCVGKTAADLVAYMTEQERIKKDI